MLFACFSLESRCSYPRCFYPQQISSWTQTPNIGRALQVQHVSAREGKKLALRGGKWRELICRQIQLVAARERHVAAVFPWPDREAPPADQLRLVLECAHASRPHVVIPRASCKKQPQRASCGSTENPCALLRRFSCSHLRCVLGRCMLGSCTLPPLGGASAREPRRSGEARRRKV
jgi:hypothetical protein